MLGFNMLDQCRNGNKTILAILLAIFLLCMNAIAQGSMLDITVVYDGKPAGQATIYIDDVPIGQTLSDGTLNQISISSGGHTAVAKWKDDNGQQRVGTSSFSALPNSSTSVRIELK
jgi:hypothetical protein